jgi:hypothetical protein
VSTAAPGSAAASVTCARTGLGSVLRHATAPTVTTADVLAASTVLVRLVRMLPPLASARVHLCRTAASGWWRRHRPPRLHGRCAAAGCARGHAGHRDSHRVWRWRLQSLLFP